MPSLFYLKIGADHMLRLHIVPDWGVGHDGAGSRALRTADDPDFKVVVVEILHKLHHRQIETVYVAHVVEARVLLLPELHNIVVKLFNSHARIGLCEVSRERLVGHVSGPDRRGDCLELIRDAFRVIVEAVFNEHHRVIVGIEGLAGERTVHIEHSDAIFDRDKVRPVLLCDSADVVDQLIPCTGAFVPKRKRVGAVYCRLGSFSSNAEGEKYADSQQRAKGYDRGCAPNPQFSFSHLDLSYLFRYADETGKVKYVLGYGSFSRQKCHHSQSMGRKPFRTMTRCRSIRLAYCSSVTPR